jgi:glutamate synthase domain-containing protein 1
VAILDPAWRPSLGAMFAPMLAAMAARGPDSTGIAWFDGDGDGETRVSVLGAGRRDWEAVARAVGERVGTAIAVRGDGDSAVFSAAAGLISENELTVALAATDPDLLVIGSGPGLDVSKSVGRADGHLRRFGIAERGGHIAVGHTRMATESAVTASGCHPFAPGDGLVLVHNGSFSNYTTVRADLLADGVVFDSDNDSEVCARFVRSRLIAGAGLGDALAEAGDVLDGFYTLLVATPATIALSVDPIGCKPAVVAEHPAYVAIASEYHALANLPDIGNARLFEPAAGSIHAWDAV